MNRVIIVVGLLLLGSFSFARAAPFLVTTNRDFGPGSLRQAILDANSNADQSAISFAIPGNQTHVIALNSPLPAITHPVILDGYTQTNATSNTLEHGDDAVLKVVLDGAGAGVDANGLHLQSDYCTVRGLVIEGFGGSGIFIDAGHSNVITGNFIGTDSAGVSASGNGANGVWVVFGDGNRVGGSLPAERNVISGNDPYAVEVLEGFGNRISGNFVGVRANGMTSLPNGFGGVSIQGGASNAIGGTSPGAGNVVSGNASSGVQISSDDNLIQGNIIGLNAEATALAGNVNHGIAVDGVGNLIGGSVTGAGNVVAGNSRHGIVISGAGSAGNSILGNSVFSNGFFGIDLGDDGITTNDVQDADSGPNGLQNFPYLASVLSGNGTIITAILTSAPATTYRIEFFVSDAADLLGFGEGKNFLGFTNATTTANGVAGFTFLSDANLALGTFVTATATDPGGNTSEFSQAAPVTAFPTNLQTRIIVNGVSSVAAVTTTNQATVEIESPFAGGTVYYTLNGVEPRFGPPYVGPFVVAPAALTDESLQIRAVAFDPTGSQSSGASPVTVSFRHTPVILEQPEDMTAVAGTIAAFTVSAGGSAPLNYQWLLGGTILTGVTNSVLQFSNLQPPDEGFYSVVVSNPVGVLTSRVARLSVIATPTIRVQPTGTNVALHGTARFCVDAVGTPDPRYQWRHNGANIPNATNACYLIADVSLADGGTYNVAVANEAGVVSSVPVELVITSVFELQAGDLFSGRVLITGLAGAVRGTNDTNTEEPFEPRHAGRPGGRSAWYRWRAPTNGVASFRSEGSGFDTLLAVYEGGSLPGLIPVVSDDDTAGFFTSKVQFNALAGTEYSIAVDGFAGTGGKFVLSWTNEATSEVLPVIEETPTGVTVRQGEPATLGINATGTGLTYQWFFNGEPITAATNSTFTRTNVQPSHVGFYNVRVSNAQMRSVDSPAAILEIGPTNFQSLDKPESLFAITNPAPPGILAPASWFTASAGTAQGFISVSLGTRDTQIVNNATNSYVSPSESNHCAYIGSATRWLALKPLANAILVVDTLGSAIPTVSGIYTQGLAFSLVQLACTVDPPGSPRTPMRIPVRSNVTYLVVADGYNGAKGLISLNWGLGFPPVHLSAASNLVQLELGQSITLRCPSDATNGVVPAPAFQWLLKGTPLPGATQPTLTLTNYSPEMAGTSSVVISNFLGVVTNAVARLLIPLHVEVRPFFGMNQLAVHGEPGAPFALQRSDDLSHWETLGTGRIPTNGNAYYFEDDARVAPVRQYRVIPLLEALTLTRSSTNALIFRVRSPTGRPVVLQGSGTLLDWVNILTNMSGALDLEISVPPNSPGSFFRLKSWP